MGEDNSHNDAENVGDVQGSSHPKSIGSQQAGDEAGAPQQEQDQVAHPRAETSDNAKDDSQSQNSGEQQASAGAEAPHEGRPDTLQLPSVPKPVAQAQGTATSNSPSLRTSTSSYDGAIDTTSLISDPEGYACVVLNLPGYIPN